MRYNEGTFANGYYLKKLKGLSIGYGPSSATFSLENRSTWCE